MLSRNATFSVLAESGSGAPATRAGTTWLPSATNSSSAAIVAHVVMMWLPAMRTALLLALLNLRSTSCPAPLWREEVNFLLR